MVPLGPVALIVELFASEPLMRMVLISPDTCMFNASTSPAG